jgi:branched-chain amino acid aminotransferase
MTEKDLIDFNGKILPASTPVLTSQNRAFRYGDGLFESIRVINGNISLFPLHYQRLVNGLKYLKINLPDNFTEDFCEKKILNFVNEAGIAKNARIRLSVFRTDGGFYLPENNDAEYLIEGTALRQKGYSQQIKGLTVDIYTDIEKHVNPLASYKTNNALIYIMAAIHRQEQKLDDCLLINSRSHVIESIDSNLFLVKNNELYTPPLAEGCVTGVMREFILFIANKENIPVHESPVTLEDLFEADEAFLSNAIYGIRWIEKYKSKTYTNDLSTTLSGLIENALIGN